VSGFRSVVAPRVLLSDDAFRSRHRVLRVILWLQLPLLAAVAVANRRADAAMTDMGGARDSVYVMQVMSLALVGCAVAAAGIRQRRAGSLVVSLGLLLSAALLVSFGGGRTDLHFGFFLVVGLISLYQDWLPLALSVVLVVVHHLVMGEMAPAVLYSDPRAAAEAVRYAALHGGFVLGCCAVQVAYWHFAQRAQEETEQIRVQAERVVRRNAERFEALVHDGADVIAVVDGDERIVSMNAAVERVMGYRPTALIGGCYRELMHPDDLARLRVALGAGGEARAEVRVRHADGEWHWHDMALRDMRGNRAVGGWVVNHRDVTARRQAQEQLEYDASHDLLTGLANRAELLRILEQENGPGTAVLYLDLNGFKQVNDQYGHETGDGLLISVARSLRRCVLGSDTTGRLGGDEFAIVLTNITGPDDAIAVAARILNEVGRPVEINGRTFTPGVSIGIALAAPGITTTVLLHQADTAMYHAKRERTAGWRLFVDGLHDPSAPAPALEDDLRLALDFDQLRVRYLPVVELGSGDLLGFEALVRWQHPTLGLLPPEQFIPLADQARLAGPITDWVLRIAGRQLAAWQQRLGSRLGLSVNVAPRQLATAESVRQILTTLRETGLPPGDLTLEITEGALAHADHVVAALAELRGHGIRIALDDFGTGSSSLAHLTRLPLDVLKLDGRFVAELNGTPAASPVAETFVQLGRILRLDTVAEGVETAEQAAELRALGCRTAQGYHFAGPLDEAAIDQWLAGRSAPPLGQPAQHFQGV
jgi:diguanylate cyclase (GGDEF)-like protein/PAS domain S-box-containing protein